MRTLQGYYVRETLHTGGNKVILRVERQADGLRGILQFFDHDARSDAELERIKDEVGYLKAVHSENVIRVHDLVFFERGIGILMEDFAAESLDTFMKRRGALELEEFFDVAIKLTRGLRDIHHEKVIHRDIKPSNVLFEEQSSQLKIIDFGLSNAFSASDAEDRFGSLPYLSPERTGKMNRSVDYRSDVYSLGVVFYELLSGRCPFQSADPLEIVHAHIAKVPEPVRSPGGALPEALVRMVSRLLEKEADARYQSAAGVLADLETCASLLAQGEAIPSELPLATRDRRQLFQIPQKFYGREAELQRLLEIFERAAGARFEPVLVSGYSGIGKSSLIGEVQKPLVAARGFFAAGKYDQFNKAIPYSAIQQALGELVRTVLRRTEDEVERWRRAIQTALGDEGQCLVEVVPRLEALIGPQPELAETGFVGQQKRFNRNCDALLRVFAAADHPLVLFLDDAQWADSASLQLIRSWLDDEIPYAMLILAYRDNEVPPNHPLALMLREGLRERLKDCQIRLGPLGKRDADTLLADTLQRDIGEVGALGQVLIKKTGGNPFFLIQMLRGLHRDELIRFEQEDWTWNIEEIESRDLADNVVELMTQKLRRYPEVTASALNMGAILGAPFALEWLALALSIPSQQAYQALLPAIRDGLIVESQGSLRFAHDKIHEASYALVSEEERERRHHQIGLHLLRTLGEAELDAQIFKVTDDLNVSRALIGDERERVQLIQLNLRAGSKALKASAFTPSRKLFETAISLLPPDAWSSHFQLAYDAHFGLADAAYACAQYEECERALQVCMRHIPDPVQNVRVVQMLLDTYVSLNEHRKAYDLGQRHLRRLGLKLPRKANKGHILARYFALRKEHRKRPLEQLLDLPEATDEKAVATLAVLNALIPSAFLVHPELSSVVGLELARLSLRHGNTVYTPYGYCMCMGVAAGVFKQIGLGRDYMELALALRDRYPNAKQRGRVELSLSCFMLHQVAPMGDWERAATNAITYNLDSGYVLFADYVLRFTRCQSLFFGTRTLDDVYQSNLDVLELHRKHEDPEVIDSQAFVLRTLNVWRNPSDALREDTVAEVANIELDAYRAKVMASNNFVLVALFTVLRQAQQYLEGDYVGSLRTASVLMASALDLIGNFTEHAHRFFFNLAYLAVDLRDLSAKERAGYRAYYLVNRGLFSIYDKHAPNYRSHVALMTGDEHRRGGRLREALRHYNRAIEEAHSVSRFNEVLAYRRLLSLHVEEGLEVDALLVARQMWAVCRSFRFRSEADRLEREFPGILLHAGGLGQPGSAPSTLLVDSPSSLTHRLDLASLARGAQAISSQVRLEGSIEALLRQLHQSSAAQRVVLFLKEDGNLRLQGEIAATGQTERFAVLQNEVFPVERGSHSIVAESVVQYVARMAQKEVLGDACAEGGFTQDPYIQDHALKSILCMPILHQGKLLGVLYLENALAADAFTSEHQEVLEVLSSQAAISFENAYIYQSLERRVEERTEELNRKTNDLSAMLQNLEQGVFMILQDGTIHGEYSQHLEAILGTRSIAGRDFREVLLSDCSLPADVVSQVVAAVRFSVGCDVLWFESNRHLLVQEMDYRRDDGSTRRLELSWSPILSREEVVERLLVSVKDVTELRRLEHQTREQRRDLEIIGEILSLPSQTFLEVLRDSEQLVAHSAVVLGSDGLDADSLAGLFRSVHTIKGNARTHGLWALSRAAHDAEETCERCREAPVADWDPGRVQEDTAALRECLGRYRRVYTENLESFAGSASERTAIDAALLQKLCAATDRAKDSELAGLLSAIGTLPLEDLVEGISGAVRQTARELGKPSPVIRVSSQGVRFRPEAISMLRAVFTHLARNAVDHGLESAAERRARGKPEVGEISFTARLQEEECEILVHDDGRGLPLEKLRSIALERALEAESDEELAELVFVPGLSTAAAIDDISGRGVGMDAIRRFVSERGGKVDLLLLPEGGEDGHRPFTTRLLLPVSQVVQLACSGDGGAKAVGVAPAG